MAKEILNGNSDNPIRVDDASDPILESMLGRVRVEVSDTHGKSATGSSNSGDWEEARFKALKNYHDKK